MFCEDEVLEAAAWPVILHEIGRNKEKRKKPRKKMHYKNTDKSATPSKSFPSSHRPQSVWKTYRTVP
jgi:hypothetical protein